MRNLDRLPGKGKAINRQYYASELRQPKIVIKLKHRVNLRAGVLLIQNNVPVHTAQLAISEATNCGFELLPFPSYLPFLAASDFLSPKLKFSPPWSSSSKQ